jgi:hypothetical protein
MQLLRRRNDSAGARAAHPSTGRVEQIESVNVPHTPLALAATDG